METIAQSSTFRWFSKTSRAVSVKLSFGHKAANLSNFILASFHQTCLNFSASTFFLHLPCSGFDQLVGAVPYVAVLSSARHQIASAGAVGLRWCYSSIFLVSRRLQRSLPKRWRGNNRCVHPLRIAIIKSRSQTHSAGATSHSFPTHCV